MNLPLRFHLRFFPVFFLQYQFEILVKGVAVAAFEKRITDLLDQAQAAPVADHRHERVHGPVPDDIWAAGGDPDAG